VIETPITIVEDTIVINRHNLKYTLNYAFTLEQIYEYEILIYTDIINILEHAILLSL